MTNGEKYKSATEREEAFSEWCEKHCEKETCAPFEATHCLLRWLELDAEEDFDDIVSEMHIIRACNIEGNPLWDYVDRLIAAHNRVAKIVMESEAAK